jgi:hypothetical protein
VASALATQGIKPYPPEAPPPYRSFSIAAATGPCRGGDGPLRSKGGGQEPDELVAVHRLEMAWQPGRRQRGRGGVARLALQAG